MSSIITAVRARMILDCRGYPTVQVDMTAGGQLGRADVPAGRSTGSSEAAELRDGGAAYRGKGVARAVAHVNEQIGPAVLGRDAADQVGLDRLLCELDGTKDKSRLGANAILGVSLAAARAAAACAGLPLFRYLRADARVLPVPFVNLINGGRLTSNDLDFQEFICMPVGAATFSEALRMASECHMALMEIVVGRYGKLAANTGDEGGFATPIVDVREALEVLHEGVAAAGYAGRHGLRARLRGHAPLGRGGAGVHRGGAAPTRPASSSTSTRSSRATSASSPSRTRWPRTTGTAGWRSRGGSGPRCSSSATTCS